MTRPFWLQEGVITRLDFCPLDRVIGPGILITPRMSNSKASVFPPALSRQFAMAAARSSDQGGDQVRPDDSKPLIEVCVYVPWGRGIYNLCKP